MEGAKLARSLSIFKDKYEGIIKEMDLKAAEELPEADSEAKDNPEPLAGFPDGKFVELTLLNQYIGLQVKKEFHNYEKTKRMNIMHLCTSVHGGEFDNPKVVNEASGNSLEKWDIIFQALNPKNIRKSEKHQDKVLSSIIPCESTGNFELRDYPSTTKKNFISTVQECTEKIYIHAQTMANMLLENGDILPLYSVLGSVILTLNKLLFYSNFFKDGDTDPFSKLAVTLKNIMDTISKEIIVYHKDVISTVVLHEGESNDWSSVSQPYEGKRISINIQFWWYYMNGTRTDLYNSLSSSAAKKILMSVLNESLGILTVRYCQITPHLERMPQFRGDIIAILMTALDLLLGLVPRLSHLFCPLPIHTISRSVHTKCTALTLALTCIGMPINSLSSSISKDDQLVQNNKLEPIDKKNNSLKSREEELIRWLSITSVHSSSTNNLRLLSDSSFVSILARHASLQPQPEWSLIVRLVLSRNMTFACLVMQNIGAYIPEETPTDSNCNYLMCSRQCVGTASKRWSQIVGSGILYIVMYGNPEPGALSTVLGPLLRKLSCSSWEILDANFIWNIEKPVWYRSLLELLEPFFRPVINDLIDDVDSGKTWTLSQIPEAIKKINVNIMDVAYCIPPSFYQVCELIENLIPDSIRPLCDSIVVHFFFAAIYSIITKLIPVFRAWKMQREKLNFLIALGEKICRMESSPELQKIEGLTDASGNMKTEKDFDWNNSNEEFINSISKMVADSICEEPEGQRALKSVHRFVSFNSEWIRCALNVGIFSSDAKLVSTNIKPWDSTTLEDPSPFEAVEHINGMAFENFLQIPLPNTSVIKHIFQYANPNLGLLFLNRRIENYKRKKLKEEEDFRQEGESREEDDMIKQNSRIFDCICNYFHDK